MKPVMRNRWGKGEFCAMLPTNIRLYAFWFAMALVGVLIGNLIVSHPIAWATGGLIGLLWGLWLSYALWGRWQGKI